MALETRDLTGTNFLATQSCNNNTQTKSPIFSSLCQMNHPALTIKLTAFKHSTTHLSPSWRKPLIVSQNKAANVGDLGYQLTRWKSRPIEIRKKVDTRRQTQSSTRQNG